MNTKELSKFDEDYIKKRIEELNNPSKFEHYKSITEYMNSRKNKSSLKDYSIKFGLTKNLI